MCLNPDLTEKRYLPGVPQFCIRQIKRIIKNLSKIVQKFKKHFQIISPHLGYQSRTKTGIHAQYIADPELCLEEVRLLPGADVAKHSLHVLLAVPTQVLGYSNIDTTVLN